MGVLERARTTRHNLGPEGRHLVIAEVAVKDAEQLDGWPSKRVCSTKVQIGWCKTVEPKRRAEPDRVEWLTRADVAGPAEPAHRGRARLGLAASVAGLDGSRRHHGCSCQRSRSAVDCSPASLNLLALQPHRAIPTSFNL